MLNKRMIAPMAISAGMLILLSQFQNCASIPASANIESKPTGTFTFSHRHLEVYDEASAISLTGTCERASEGANLQWNLLNNQGSPEPMATGDTACVNGSFQFTVSLKDDMICGLDHVVRLQSPRGEQVELEIIKRCQPLASMKLPGQCELEFNLKSEDTGGRVCEKVCYSANRLVSSELRLAEECESLASTLAGQ